MNDPKSVGEFPGDFNLGFDQYTFPVYYVKDATDQFTVKEVGGYTTNIGNTKIPFNPLWEASPGSDSQIILLDPASGKEWNLWQVSVDVTKKLVNISNGNLVSAGEERDGVPGNYWTKENGFKPSRGIGIQYFAMLVVPEEIQQGKIEHALTFAVPNPDGTFSVPPATKIEHPTWPGGGVPEGMRFALNVTNAQIDSWIASLPAELSAQTKRSARIIAVALRDYGWFITDTGGNTKWQFEDRKSAGAEWDALGLGVDKRIGTKKYPKDLLDGLLQRDRVYAIVPSDQY